MLACVCVGLPRDMIVLACVEIHHIRSWWLGLLAGGEQVDFAGGVCWAHPASTCCGCMFVSLDTVGLLRCLWAIPVMGASRGPLWRIRMRTEMLAPAYKEPVGVTMISGTLWACTPLIHYAGGSGPRLVSVVPSL